MTELEVICAELICGDDVRAEAAVVRLPEFGNAALKNVRKLLNDPCIDKRWWAVRALAVFDNTSPVTEDLLCALEDASGEIRQVAIMAFCNHPNLQALVPLIRLLSDKDPMTSKLASNALILLGQPAVSALLDVMEKGELSARLEAVRALAEIKDPQAIPGLLRALDTDSALMQYWAGQGLDNLGVGMLYFKPE
jgi:HEAT repeat protein